MSLVVAKKKNNKIFVVSDTCIDNPDNLNRVDLVAPAEYSQIKTLIINPFICVSFAGEIVPAREALAACRRLNYKVDEIINYLLSVNISSENKADFIVCVALPPYLIYEIKDSKINKVESAWIGHQNGFNEFQRHFHSLPDDVARKDLSNDMENSMVAAIESNVAGVNGFIISVSNEKMEFHYKNFIRSYILPATIIPGKFHVITHGTAQEGGYTVNIFPNNRRDVLAIHIHQNRFGIIYSLKDNCFLEPEVCRDVDEFEFAEITKARFGINPGYGLSSLQKSYFERGNKASSKKEFLEAIQWYDKGLSSRETALCPELHFNKGVCLFHLSKYPESTISFNESVKLKSKMQPKVFQFLAQYARRK